MAVTTSMSVPPSASFSPTLMKREMATDLSENLTGGSQPTPDSIPGEHKDTREVFVSSKLQPQSQASANRLPDGLAPSIHSRVLYTLTETSHSQRSHDISH